jgi:hypothetical protein
MLINNQFVASDKIERNEEESEKHATSRFEYYF